jgi:dihydroorotate dehydrogenase
LPILIKIAPDLDDNELKDIAHVLTRKNVIILLIKVMNFIKKLFFLIKLRKVWMVLLFQIPQFNDHLV